MELDHRNNVSKVCVYVCVCTSSCPLNCETQLEYLTQGWAEQVTQKKKKPREMERGRKLIFIDMRIMMIPNRECEQPDLWIKCVYLCVHAVSVKIHSSIKTCLFADKTCTSSEFPPVQFYHFNVRTIQFLFIYLFVLPSVV